MNAMSQCPPESDLMKAWNAYKETESYKNSLYWASTDLRMRQERAAERGIPPEANRATPEMRRQYAEGSLWAAFMNGWDAAGGKDPHNGTRQER